MLVKRKLNIQIRLEVYCIDDEVPYTHYRHIDDGKYYSQMKFHFSFLHLHFLMYSDKLL